MDAGQKQDVRIARRLRRRRAEAGVLELEGAGLVLRIMALAPDLWRVSMRRRETAWQNFSWAVLPREREAGQGVVRAGAGGWNLSTGQGSLAVDARSGGWAVRDRSGLEVFRGMAGGLRMDEAGVEAVLALTPREAIFGLGSSTGTFNKRGLTREFWNTDLFAHAPAMHPALRNLYLSIPFGISLREGRVAGLFWDNPARQVWDMGQTQADLWQMRAAAGELDLYLFLGPTPAAVLERYTELTGRMPLPPIWSLGYHQSRYGYETRAEVERVAREFRRREIPCDVLHLDIHHMDGYRAFTFGKAFKRPAELVRRLARKGFKTVTIVDPCVKEDPRYGVYRRGRARRAFVAQPEGQGDYVGRVWPGRACFPDFLDPQVRSWWAEEQRFLHRLGVAGVWNDMNEPSDFEGPGRTLPLTCPHRTEAGVLPHSRVHNVYGSSMAEASRAGALASQPGRRPFVISRAGYAGLQRHAMVWTGDNSSVWEHLQDSVQMLANLGASGLAFCGADAGGFLEHATPELLVRWMQCAAFTPFFRNHSNIGTLAQEPWARGPEVEECCRRAVQWRYQWIPFFYRLFVEAHRTGAPILRPLWWEFPNDPAAVAVGDQFLLGREVLVAPVVQAGAAARSVYLPAGRWYDYYSGRCHAGRQHVLALAPLERIPVYVRAGSVLPTVAVRPWLEAPADAWVNLHVWPGAASETRWYEDDGVTQDYLRGGWVERRLTFSSKGRAGRLRIGPAEGTFVSRVKHWRVIWRGGGAIRSVRVNGERVPGAVGSELVVVEVPVSKDVCEVEFR